MALRCRGREPSTPSALEKEISEADIPIDEGGWNVCANYTSGVGVGVGAVNPATQAYLRGIGKAATFGWPTDPTMETLRNAWLDAEDVTRQKAIARGAQLRAFDQAPYLPLGALY